MIGFDYISPEFAHFLASYLAAEVEGGSGITPESVLNAYIIWLNTGENDVGRVDFG